MSVPLPPVPPPRRPPGDPQTPIQYLKGVGPRFAALFEKLGVSTVEDLLTHYPQRYEDRRSFRPLGRIRPGETVVTCGRVWEVIEEQSRRRGMEISRVVLRDATGEVELVFFRQRWVKAVFERLRGKLISVYGTAVRAQRQLSFQHPEWEELVDEADSIHLNRIVPVHGATEGLTPRWIRQVIYSALRDYARNVPETVPPEVLRRRDLPRLEWSLQQAHFPESEGNLELARRHLVFDELFRLQAALALRKRAIATQLPGIPFAAAARASDDPEHPGEALARSLPFALTAAQRRATTEILEDMARPVPMNRLLQGDVGSGKTIVAAAAVVAAVQSGKQAAVMVPTEILADQHLNVFRLLLQPLGIEVQRLVASVRAKGKRLIKEMLRTGELPVVIGTHALLQEDVEFRDLGLVVIDEQHRFGVMQRLTLIDKGMMSTTPDLLVMTATPIPRSLALTVYGDLDVSLVDEMPPGRKPIRTHWKRKDQAESVYAGVRKLVQQGRQAYVVCPLVEQSDKLQAQAASALFEELRSDVFPELRVGLVHGQMPGHEKDAAMEAFRAHEVDVLVATVVIEVGVDVPNACAMVIQDAERFGLAQLHQLRGRVGRGDHQSFCVLLADPTTPEGEARLAVLTRTTDGFEIADEDLRLRGPGEFLGTRQAGILRLRIANIVGDAAILRQAREDAFEVVRHDPELHRPEHIALRADIERRYADILLAAVG